MASLDWAFDATYIRGFTVILFMECFFDNFCCWWSDYGKKAGLVQNYLLILCICHVNPLLMHSVSFVLSWLINISLVLTCANFREIIVFKSPRNHLLYHVTHPYINVSSPFSICCKKSSVSQEPFYTPLSFSNTECLSGCFSIHENT